MPSGSKFEQWWLGHFSTSNRKSGTHMYILLLLTERRLMCTTYCMPLIIDNRPAAPIPYVDDESEESGMGALVTL